MHSRLRALVGLLVLGAASAVQAQTKTVPPPAQSQRAPTPEKHGDTYCFFNRNICSFDSLNVVRVAALLDTVTSLRTAIARGDTSVCRSEAVCKAKNDSLEAELNSLRANTTRPQNTRPDTASSPQKAAGPAGSVGQAGTSSPLSGLPFVSKPLTRPEDKEVLARLVEVGAPINGIQLYAPRDSILVAWKTAFSDLGLETRASLANHIRSLEVISCPKVETNLAWVRVRDKGISLTGWRRTLGIGIHQGELCLWNKEKARIEASLGCGNIIPNLPWGNLPTSPSPNLVSGPQGLQGPVGPAGPMGPQGPQGPPGQDALVAKSGHKVWPWVAGILAAAGGTCFIASQIMDNKPFRCFGNEITSINRNSVENGMNANKRGILIPLRWP